MLRVGQRRKRDTNENGIVAALKAVGAEVTRISGPGAPDLLCRFRGRLYAFEVKSEKGTPTQAQQQTQWPIVRTVEDAVQAIGAVKKPAQFVCRRCGEVFEKRIDRMEHEIAIHEANL